MKTPRFVTSGLLALGLTCSSSAIEFDFESVASGYYNSLSVTEGGLTLTVTSSGGWVFAGGSGVPLLGNVAVVGSQVNPLQSNQFAPLTFSFSSSVTSATFRFGDAGGDSDSPVNIYAYDSLSNLISSITASYPSGYDSGKSLTWTGTGASYFVMESTPGDNNHSLLWEVGDVVASNAVPDTAGTLGLLAGSLAGLAALRRRIARA